MDVYRFYVERSFMSMVYEHHSMYGTVHWFTKRTDYEYVFASECESVCVCVARHICVSN